MDSTPGWNRIDDRDIDGDQEENRKSRIKRKQTEIVKIRSPVCVCKNTLFMKSKRSDSFYFLNIENNDIMYKSERSV